MGCKESKESKVEESFPTVEDLTEAQYYLHQRKFRKYFTVSSFKEYFKTAMMGADMSTGSSFDVFWNASYLDHYGGAELTSPTAIAVLTSVFQLNHLDGLIDGVMNDINSDTVFTSKGWYVDSIEADTVKISTEYYTYIGLRVVVTTDKPPPYSDASLDKVD